MLSGTVAATESVSPSRGEANLATGFPTCQTIAELQVLLLCHQYIQTSFPKVNDHVHLPHPLGGTIPLTSGQVSLAFETEVVQRMLHHFSVPESFDEPCVAVVVSTDGTIRFFPDGHIGFALSSISSLLDAEQRAVDHVVHATAWASQAVRGKVGQFCTRARAMELRQQLGSNLCTLIRKVLVQAARSPFRVGQVEVSFAARTQRDKAMRQVWCIAAIDTRDLVEVTTSVESMTEELTLGCQSEPDHGVAKDTCDDSDHGEAFLRLFDVQQADDPPAPALAVCSGLDDILPILFELASAPLPAVSITDLLALDTFQFPWSISPSHLSPLHPIPIQHARPASQSPQLSPLVIPGGATLPTETLASLIFDHIDAFSGSLAMSPSAAAAIVGGSPVLPPASTTDWLDKLLAGTLDHDAPTRLSVTTPELLGSSSSFGHHDYPSDPIVSAARHGVSLAQASLPLVDPSTIVLPAPLRIPCALAFFDPFPQPQKPAAVVSSSLGSATQASTAEIHEYVATLPLPGMGLFEHN